MAHVQYIGPSHFREFSKKDFTDAGVEDGAGKVSFAREVPQEVTQAVADHLVNEVGEFQYVELVDEAGKPVEEGDKTDDESSSDDSGDDPASRRASGRRRHAAENA